jgi:hypothetical protein
MFYVEESNKKEYFVCKTEKIAEKKIKKYFEKMSPDKIYGNWMLEKTVLPDGSITFYVKFDCGKILSIWFNVKKINKK